jgi:hypothetical protein
MIEIFYILQKSDNKINKSFEALSLHEVCYCVFHCVTVAPNLAISKSRCIQIVISAVTSRSAVGDTDLSVFIYKTEMCDKSVGFMFQLQERWSLGPA